jgi:hypothetical protein
VWAVGIDENLGLKGLVKIFTAEFLANEATIHSLASRVRRKEIPPLPADSFAGTKERKSVGPLRSD